MTALISALIEGKPVPVAVVAEPQDLKQQADAENEVTVTTNEPKRMARRLMEQLTDGD